MTKFKVGDKVIIKKYNNNGEIMPYWISSIMDDLDGQITTVTQIDHGSIQGDIRRRDYLLVFHPDWCEKIEDVLPDDHPVEANEVVGQTEDALCDERIDDNNEAWEQREYNLYISLINKYIEQIMSGEEVLIKNCKTMARNIIKEFKR